MHEDPLNDWVAWYAQRLRSFCDKSVVSSVHEQVAQANDFVVCDDKIFVGHS